MGCHKGYPMTDENTGRIISSFSNSGTTFESFSYTSRGLGASTDYFGGGFYESPAADANLTQASPTVTVGSANNTYHAHVFIVASGAGTASGGSGTVEIEVSGTSVTEVSGTSVTEGGVETTSDTEVLTADITALSANEYLETAKLFTGQVTLTLQNSGASTHTTFASDFNYGFAAYNDFGNRDFTLTDAVISGIAGANDSGFNIELIKHATTGWTYSAAAFTPGPAALFQWTDFFTTDPNLVADQQFRGKLAGQSISVSGSGSEGILFRVTTGAANAVQMMSLNIGVQF